MLDRERKQPCNPSLRHFVAIHQTEGRSLDGTPLPGDAPADVALHRPIDVPPYPIRLVNWFKSK